MFPRNRRSQNSSWPSLTHFAEQEMHRVMHISSGNYANITVYDEKNVKCPGKNIHVFQRTMPNTTARTSMQFHAVRRQCSPMTEAHQGSIVTCKQLQKRVFHPESCTHASEPWWIQLLSPFTLLFSRVIIYLFIYFFYLIFWLRRIEWHAWQVQRRNRRTSVPASSATSGKRPIITKSHNIYSTASCSRIGNNLFSGAAISLHL